MLTLSPFLGLISGSVFFAKAGILSGMFYVPAIGMFLLSGLMAVFPTLSLPIFGVASAAAFFFPGLKYYRRRRSNA